LHAPDHPLSCSGFGRAERRLVRQLSGERAQARRARIGADPERTREPLGHDAVTSACVRRSRSRYGAHGCTVASTATSAFADILKYDEVETIRAYVIQRAHDEKARLAAE